MKIIFSEYKSNSKKYRYPYQVYAIREGHDLLNSIYEKGFLPSRSRKDLFYLSRSIRIDLEKFELSSENRRIMRKAEYLQSAFIPRSDFKYDYTIGKLGKDFYETRFGKGTMSVYRLKWLFTSGSMSHIIEYKDKGKDSIVGYCIVNVSNKLIHYAYPFYKLDYFKRDAGMGMMLQAINWAKEGGLKFIYLGTCYTNDALYKLQFKGVEYFTGYSWSEDVEKLKFLVRNEQKDGHIIEDVEDKDKIFDKNGVKF